MLSAIIITKNEAINIERCLQAIQWVDEIIIVDSGSTDNTLDIVKQYTQNIYVHDWQGYGIQKQYALSLAHGDWVLNIDADEVVTPELRQTIQKIILSSNYDAYRISIRMNFYGQVMRYSSSPARHIRLFKRAGASYSNDTVHEKVLLPTQFKIGVIKDDIMHFCYKNVSHAIAKMNLYSSYTAKTQRPTGLFKVICATVWMFYRCFIIQRGFLDKKAGFLLAVINAEGAFYRGIKRIYKDKV